MFGPSTRGCGLQDTILENVILECCELVGRYIVPDSYLPHMLSRIREEPEVNPTGNRYALKSMHSFFAETRQKTAVGVAQAPVLVYLLRRCSCVRCTAAPTKVHVCEIVFLFLTNSCFN